MTKEEYLPFYTQLMAAILSSPNYKGFGSYRSEKVFYDTKYHHAVYDHEDQLVDLDQLLCEAFSAVESQAEQAAKYDE